MRIAQQIYTKLMHPSEKFCQNFLVKFYFLEDFNFLIHELKQRKICGTLKRKNSKTLPYALEAASRKRLCFQIKDYWTQTLWEKFSGKVKFVHFFKVIVLKHVIMMKPEINLIISSALDSNRADVFQNSPVELLSILVIWTLLPKQRRMRFEPVKCRLFC